MKRIVAALITLATCAGLACGSSTTVGTTNCTIVTPDGGTSTVTPDGGTPPDIVCDIGWSCAAGTSNFELQCSLNGSNYQCQCFEEGVPTRGFAVNSFLCDSTAQSAATTGCGWTLQ